MTKTRKSRIPKFKSFQEEAKFWDTHDTTDYEAEFKPIKIRFAKNLSESITVRFDKEVLTTLRQEATTKGIGATTLIRMWVLERLGQQKQNQAIT